MTWLLILETPEIAKKFKLPHCQTAGNSLKYSQMATIAKIISGGQTGADRGALEAALKAHFPYGGLVPQGRLAEDGRVPARFKELVEAETANYRFRTKWNVEHSDATLILAFSGELEGGTQRTRQYCMNVKKPVFIDNPASPAKEGNRYAIFKWLEDAAKKHGGAITLNVAGPRESKVPGLEAAAREYIARLIAAQCPFGIKGNENMKKASSRKCDQLRPIEFVRDFTKHASGSVLVKWGDTWVLCTASVENKVPPFLKGSGKGWVTAEYSMLPSSTGHGRKERDIAKLKLDGRTTEIQRLIGRSLRAAIALDMLGERTITIDCDVLQADGGTRCASITGGMLALEDAIAKMIASGELAESPLLHRIAAVSVGVCNGKPTLDLDYAHDSTAEVDLNVIMTDDGRYVEIQGTAEREPFSEETFDVLRTLARKGLKRIFAMTAPRRC